MNRKELIWNLENIEITLNETANNRDYKYINALAWASRFMLTEMEKQDRKNRLLVKKYDVPAVDFEIKAEPNIVFSFFPNESRVYGFKDEYPKTWDEVYKVYYSWAIFTDGKLVFDMDTDENSAISGIANAIRKAIKTKSPNTLVVRTMGQPGSDWEINYIEAFDWVDTGEEFEYIRVPEKDYLKISLWDNWMHKGYQFWLDISKANAFADYFDKVNAHMLKEN